MLHPEQAKKQLGELRIAGEHDRRRKEARNLPDPLPEITDLIFENFRNEWGETQKRITQAGDMLDSLPAEQRLRFFATLFPDLEQFIEHAWHAIQQLPYQGGWGRMSFRSPDHPEHSAFQRAQWLRTLFNAVGSFQKEVTWYAAWAGYVEQHGLASLFAAAIDSGGAEGQEVFEILVASAQGEHEIGVMGRHVVRSLLTASRPDGWEFIEKMLIAAQRQEGLRQVILESIDETHPDAFGHMVQLILDKDLLRFSSVVRAVDVWFGMGWTVDDVRAIRTFLEKLRALIDNPDAQRAALSGEDAEAIYMALWNIAFRDAYAAIEAARPLIDDPNPDNRFAAVHLLGQLSLRPAREMLVPMISDVDLRVAYRAYQAQQLSHYQAYQTADVPVETDLFEHIEGLLKRFSGDSKTLPAGLWGWQQFTLDRSAITDSLMAYLGTRSPEVLLPYLDDMSLYGRARLIKLLDELEPKTAAVRQTLLAMVGDKGSWVREAAIKAVARLTIDPDEARHLESLMHRKATDLRRAVISLLVNQPDAQVLASADRLLDGSKEPVRMAGLEILRLLVEKDRSVAAAQSRAEAYRGARAKLTQDEEKVIDQIVGEESVDATLDNALGLLDVSKKSAAIHPTTKRREYLTPAAAHVIDSLDAAIGNQQRALVMVKNSGVEQEMIFGNIHPFLINRNHRAGMDHQPPEMPLSEVWEEWFANRPADQRDPDGLELVRALALAPAEAWVKRMDEGSTKRVAEVVLNNGDWQERQRYPLWVKTLLLWLLRMHPPAGLFEFLFDATETAFALIPNDDLARLDVPNARSHDMVVADLWWRRNKVTNKWLELLREVRGLGMAGWTAEHDARLWRLTRWIDEPGIEDAKRLRVPLDEMVAAYRAGAASEADVTDHLLGPRPTEHSYYGGFRDLWGLSTPKPPKEIEDLPAVQAIVEQIRQRIVEIEANRGDMPTAASAPARGLRAIFGADALIKLVRGLGRDDLIRGWSYDGYSRPAILSHLIRATLPREDETYEDFVRQVREANVPAKRLVELAVYTPHWARFIQRFLNWAGLEEAVWWLHAHTKDQGWHVERDVRELWNAEVTERTPLAAHELTEGAVDVGWFHRMYQQLGDDRWKVLHEAAKFAAGGAGHARATLFADALLGRVEKAELIERIMKKRHQDSVRALGLLPLQSEADVLERYQTVQEFLRTGKKFGSQRKASEKLAAGIAMQNLARTAGYPDPIRLEWAMEAQANADLADGTLQAVVGDVTVTLSINAWGEAEIDVARKGKPLKAIPPKIKKDDQVAHVLTRKQEVQRQTSRMRQSLEQAMNRGDHFLPDELRSLMTHPILRPMLEQVVFTGKSGMGYPVDQGRALVRYDGTTQRIRKTDQLRIAHPYDLLAAGDWHEWQHECFIAERIQPFKQVFRELYVLTEAEKADHHMSRRYAGHQVQPNQAAALLGQRGWVVHPHEGVRRTFHEAGISVWLSAYLGYGTPADVEGAPLEGVHFSRRGEWQSMPLEDVPPRVFSEAMRDIDLIVSVAHVGGIDPEASASTVEMRASLVRETTRLLKLDNVDVTRSHVMIEGKLGHYSVHLGSGSVHRQPGGALCIIPVHSQHRGRIFLPFADDDPRTAEVVSKVVLLSRDEQIKDPTILEQLMRVPV